MSTEHAKGPLKIPICAYGMGDEEARRAARAAIAKAEGH